MNCSYCKSEHLFLKTEGDRTGLYCKSCGRWLKWVGDAEKDAIVKQIDKQRRAVQIDGRDVERVLDQFRKLKERYKALNDEILFLKEQVGQGGSSFEKTALYEKALKLKEMNIRISVYNEILTALGIR
jgi:hypothetical protein